MTLYTINPNVKSIADFTEKESHRGADGAHLVSTP